MLKGNRSRSIDEADVALGFMTQALELYPSDHSERGSLIASLAQIWHLKGALSIAVNDRNACYYEEHRCYLEAASLTSRPPLERIKNYEKAARISPSGDWDTASRCLKDAVKLLPAIGPHSFSLEDHEFMLRGFSGLSPLAAAAALTAGHACPHKALATMELGHGIIFGLLTDTRVDVSGLEEKDSNLYREYMGVRNRVSVVANPAVSSPPLPQILAAAVAADPIFKVVENWGVEGWNAIETEGITRVPGLPSLLQGTHNPVEEETGQTSGSRSRKEEGWYKLMLEFFGHRSDSSHLEDRRKVNCGLLLTKGSSSYYPK